MLHQVFHLVEVWASLVAQRLKHLPAMWETRVRSLGREDPLEKEVATHSSILAWRIPWREEPGRLQSMGLQRVRLSYFTFTLVLQKISKMMLCVSLEGEPGPCPRLHYCSLAVLPLSLHSLPYLISNCLNCPLKLREGDIERLLCPGAP